MQPRKEAAPCIISFMRQIILRRPRSWLALIPTPRYPKKPLNNCNWSLVSLGGVEEEHRTACISMYEIASMRELALYVGIMSVAGASWIALLHSSTVCTCAGRGSPDLRARIRMTPR